MSNYKINLANIKEWAKNYDGELFDGVLCDPPYELGFMGKSWDSSGIAFDAEMWSDIYKLLKPGGHLLAFSGSRTYHRMAVAIEDAGFEIRDMIEWVYGSGFPKSLNIGKSVEAFVKTGNASKNGFHKLDGERRDGRIGMYDTVEEQGFRAKNPDQLGAYDLDPTTDEAKLWNGYGTALKPAHEPCVLARKPIEGTVAQNALKHGTGGINIDECRVKTEDKLSIHKGNLFAGNSGIDTKQNFETDGQSLGRFPANLIHDGSDEVVGLFPETKQPSMRKGDRASKVNGIVPWNKGRETGRTVTNAGYTDIGSAARFFYTAKASKSERNAGLEGFEEKPATSRMNASMARMENGVATNERAEQSKMQNSHPTVKPLSLTKYLATLIKPPTGGRLLVPFSGSGSEMIGALQAGWEYVEGVELTEEYIPIAEARIKYWIKEPTQESLL